MAETEHLTPDSCVLRVEGVSKHFGGVQALRDVQLDVRRGEVHALMGENGAGKTGVIHMVSFDFVDETMQYVKAGVIDATIGQDPFAQGHDPAIRLFNYLVAKQMPPFGRLVTKADVVTKDNVDQYWKPQPQ